MLRDNCFMVVQCNARKDSSQVQNDGIFNPIKIDQSINITNTLLKE